MKTCTECRRSGLTQKGYVPDHDEDVRLVSVEYPAPHQDKNRRTWMCALHRKYYEERGCKVQAREKKKS